MHIYVNMHEYLWSCRPNQNVYVYECVCLCIFAYVNVFLALSMTFLSWMTRSGSVGKEQRTRITMSLHTPTPFRGGQVLITA